MRILITGGNGFVGRTLCRLLLAQHEICVMDNLRFGALRFTMVEAEQLRLAHLDIRQQASVADLMADFDPQVIIHLAAIHFIPECENDPALAVSTNLQGTLNMLLAAPPGCHFVFASSGAVYQPQADANHEDRSPLQPDDIYGLTKLHGEAYVRYLARQRGLSAVVIRLFNVIGPGETNPHFLPEIIAQLKAGRTELRLGTLTAKRDYVSVDDAARGFAAVALAGTVPIGETVTVNLGTQRAYSGDDVLVMLRAIADIAFTIQSDPTRIRKQDRPILLADRQKIQELFQWAPCNDLETTLRKTWANPELPPYLTNKYHL